MFLILVFSISCSAFFPASKKPDQEHKSFLKSNIIINEFILLIKDSFEYDSDEDLIKKIKTDFSSLCNDIELEKIMPNLFSLKYKCAQEFNIKELKALDNIAYIEEIEHNIRISK